MLLPRLTGLVKLTAALLSLPGLIAVLASLAGLAALLLILSLIVCHAVPPFFRTLSRAAESIRMRLSDNLAAMTRREGWDKFWSINPNAFIMFYSSLQPRPRTSR